MHTHMHTAHEPRTTTEQVQSGKHQTISNEVHEGRNGTGDYQVTSWSVQLFKRPGLPLQQQLSVVLQSLLR